MRMSSYRGVARGTEHAGAGQSHASGEGGPRIRHARIRMGEPLIEFSFKNSCALPDLQRANTLNLLASLSFVGFCFSEETLIEAHVWKISHRPVGVGSRKILLIGTSIHPY
jgi:hypothetical protein